MSRNEATAAIAVAAITVGAALYEGFNLVADLVETGEERTTADQIEEQLVEVDVTGAYWTPVDLPVQDEERWIAFAGTGGPDSIGSAREVLEFLPPEASVKRSAGIIYSPRGISIQKIGQLIGSFTTDVGHRRVKIVAASKGGQESLRALAEMSDPPFVELFVGVGCPFNINDLPPRVRRVVQLAVESDMLGDDQQAYLVNLGQEIRKELESTESSTQSRRNLWRQAWKIATRSALETWEGQGRLYRDGAKIVGETNTAEVMQQLADRGVITEETKFVYLGSLPGLDGTVMVDSASRHYESEVRELGAWFLSLLFNGGHAEVPVALQELRRYIEGSRKPV